MRRRSRAGGQPAKPPRRKTAARKTRIAPKARLRSRSIASLEANIARLTAELNEALQRQSATANILRAISRSIELQSILQNVVDTASQLCRADASVIFRLEGGAYRFAAGYSLIPSYMEHERRNPISPGPGTLIGRAAMTRQVVQIEDALTDPLYEQKAVTGVGRSMLGVPLMSGGEPIGVIGLSRSQVSPFTQREIDLVTSFADQAVIAIENARLFEAEQQRSAELTAALEQQTATSEVLQVISRSPGELEPIFSAMLEKAVRLCGAKFGNLLLWEGNAFRTVAMHNAPPAYSKARFGELVHPRPHTSLGEVVRTKRPAQVEDIQAGPGYRAREPMVVDAVELAGIRTMLAVPMLKDEELVGSINIYRQEVLPFTDKQIEIVRNFGAQAVIAIENARLLRELRQRTNDLTESLEQQTATSEVLEVISSSPGELEPVFATMLASAARICEAQLGNLFLHEGETFRAVAWHGARAYTDDLRRQPLIIKTDMPDIPLARLAAMKRRVHIPDLSEDLAYKAGFAPLVALVDRGGARTLLIVPMLKERTLLGAIAIYRQEVRPFSDKQIALVENFAAQAVIAIENARLLSELRQRTDDLTRSLEDLRNAQDRLVQTQKLASLGQLTAGIAHEIKNPLNFVNNFSSVSAELLDELREALVGVRTDNKTRAEITELADTLRDNLNKIVQHGKRADSIVKNMLLHSREGSGEHRPVDINALVEEAVNLAYHGARAEKQTFNITLERSLAPDAGQVDCFPQEITRVLLNLISNGFYAATRRKDEAMDNGFEPILTTTTRSLGDRVEIRVRDNGIGIPPEVREKMFNPFFTTKPAGEGTGLGLSISHDIVVKQHSGSIEIDTQPGEYTEVRIILPRTVAGIAAGHA